MRRRAVHTNKRRSLRAMSRLEISGRAHGIKAGFSAALKHSTESVYGYGVKVSKTASTRQKGHPGFKEEYS